MPVLPDSAGAGSEYILPTHTSGALTWKHNVNTLAINVVGYVAVLYACHAAPGGTFAAKFGGVAMTQIGSGLVGVNTAMALFEIGAPVGLAAIAGGQNTVEVDISGMPNSIITQNLVGLSLTYSGVASRGTVLTATPTGGTANTITLADGDAPVGAYRVVSFHGVGLGNDLDAYNQARRAITPGLIGGARVLAGDAQGATSVTATATMHASTSGWLAFAVPLAPAPVSGSGTAPGFGYGIPTGRGGLYRVSIPPDLRMWRVAYGRPEQSLTEGTIVTPEGAEVAPNVAPTWSAQFIQSPHAVLDYGVIFDVGLADGDRLVAVDFTESTGDITILSFDVDDSGTTGVVWVQSGPSVALDTTYSIVAHPTTLKGRQEDKTFTLVIEPQ